MCSDLSDLYPTARFTGLSGAYAKHRPGYPAAAVDAIVAGLEPGDEAVDVGAGTGIMSRLLAERGLRVTAVEPNPDMRGVAAPHQLVRWHDAAAEATGLADRSADLIVAAQALHWFKPDAAAREFARLARPGARLAVIWNIRSTADPFTAGYQTIIERYGDRSVLKASARDGGLPHMPGFSPMRRLSFESFQTLDLQGFLGRAASASYTPAAGPARDACFRDLADHFARHAGPEGTAAFVYETVVYLGERSG
jgi:SAM-dependent methyltransferase